MTAILYKQGLGYIWHEEEISNHDTDNLSIEFVYPIQRFYHCALEQQEQQNNDMVMEKI